MTATAQPLVPGRPAAARVRLMDRPMNEPMIIFLTVLALMTLGVMMVYSATRTAHPSGDSYYFTRHVIFVPVALGALVLGTIFPYQWLNRRWIAILGILVTVVLLVAVLLVGETINHAKRWLSMPLGFMRISFQPSEFAKFAVVLFFAWFYSRAKAEPPPADGRAAAWLRRASTDPRSFVWSFVPAMAVMGVICLLILKEDFGTGAFVGLVAVALCMIAGWRWWFPLLLVGPAAAAVYLAVWLQPWRLNRVKVWWDPWKYYDGPGWHVCQSLMALGSGGLTGLGLGAGIQKMYIPENTTDFVFAVICEEMGLLGGLLVIGLFGVLVWRAVRVVRGAPDRFGFLLASGVTLVISLQAIMNIGVVTGALPAKGISLPFISYGGSGLVIMSFAAGLLCSVARQSKGGAGLGPAPSPVQPLRPEPVVYRPAR
ncbi:MAG: FtsW/RodA/SpoVE family cell cycle protein [Planctomycetota bacterium]|nr:FtsW/RodA/SpoVE family cell cycle protein [Planctomycetota bacterium]